MTWALYAVAKACETYDAPIYELTRFWSGHTLKHLVAAAASYLPLSQVGLRHRSVRPSAEDHLGAAPKELVGEA